MFEANDFLRPKGDYKTLVVFQKAECIYDLTCYFIEHYLPKTGDRTVDQMTQAARSLYYPLEEKYILLPLLTSLSEEEANALPESFLFKNCRRNEEFAKMFDL